MNDTMYKLTKQIDALTYNSRAVLNALVRSCIAAGSSNGFTVKRYGDELTLDRTDIFRLYDFYQSWANGTYGYDPFTSAPEEFDDILAKCNAKWKGDEELVTKAVVTHSKILYLVSANKSETGSDYWLGLIRDSSSPKLITNSAPIPLNLRTPLYDANLSTKSFSQHETYLFPSGYSKISITGMPGDGEDHVGGGKSWLWDIDESFEVTAPRILLGYHSNPQRRVENYRGKYSMSFGYETYALGERSVALGGLDNIAYGTNSAVVGGTNNLAIGTDSMIASGYINRTVGPSAFAFGYSVNAIGPYSMAGNRNTQSGDYAYDFTIEEPATNGKMTDCEVIKDNTTGICMTTDGSSSFTSGDGRNTVRIPYSSLVSHGFWSLNIETGDTVVIYAQNRTENGSIYSPTHENGYTFAPLYFTVMNVTRNNGDFLVQLSDAIPKGESFLSLWEYGGRIARYNRTVRSMNYMGRLGGNVSFQPGMNSNALNFDTFTPGTNQTAVGQMNYGDIDAKFMVGVGSSYVGNQSFRRNGLAVAQGYSYMQTADQTACLGVSCGRSYRTYDVRFTAHGAWMRHNSNALGYTGYSIVNDARTEIGLYRMNTSQEDSQLTFVRSQSGYLSANYDVTTCLETRAGTMVICAGSYTGASHTYDVLLQQGPLRPDDGNKGLAIYSEHGMELRNTDSRFTMSFENSGYISATFKGLFLSGETWGALTATDKARSFWVYHNANNNYQTPFNTLGHAVDYPNVIAQSGFFYAQNDWNAGKTPSSGRVNLPSRVRGNWEVHQGRGFHIINSAVSYVNSSNQGGYDVSCLILPGQVKSDEVDDPPHPKFINSFIYGTGNNGVMPTETYVAEELAYLSDLDKVKTSSYVCTLDFNTVISPGVYSRVFSGDYPSKAESSNYKNGARFGGTDGRMDTYYNYGSWKQFELCGRVDTSQDCIPNIYAPKDNPSGIRIMKYGPLVMMPIELELPTPVSTVPIAQQSEILVQMNNIVPLYQLGLGASELVLSGSGSDGVSVSCTMSANISGEFYGVNYSRILQFIVRNPNKKSGMKMPITLTGVV